MNYGTFNKGKERKEQSNSWTYLQTAYKIFNRTAAISFANFIGNASGYLGLYLLAQHDKSLTAPAALISSTQDLLMFTSASFLLSLNSVLPELHANKKDKEISPIIQGAYLLSFFVSIPVMGIMIVSSPVLQFFGQSQSNSNVAQDYLRRYWVGVIPNLFLYTNVQMLMSTNKATWLIPLNLFAFVVETFFSLILIPSYGIIGLALARAIQALATATAFTTAYHYIDRMDIKKYELFSHNQISKESQCKKLTRIGLPIATFSFIRMFVFIFQVLVIGKNNVKYDSNNELAIFLAGTKYVTLFTPIIYGLGQTTCNIIGEAKAHGQVQNIHRIAIVSFIFGLIITTIAATPLFTIPKKLADAFAPEGASINENETHHISTFFSYLAVSQTLDAVAEISSGLLRGISDINFPAMINIVCTLGIIFPYTFFKNSLESIGQAQICGTFANVIFLFLRMAYKNSTMTTTGRKNSNPVQQSSRLKHCRLIPQNSPRSDLDSKNFSTSLSPRVDI